ncbi:MAG: UDP-2,3-diacylglucosamine diphosphatase, partial [Thiohalocapsa sp.]
FDSWIGDDDNTPTHRAVVDALLALGDSGTACALMHGNRDFLIGRRFARAAGCALLRDPTRIELGGEPVLLMHGDLLCTDDIAYQRFRRKVRNPLVQRLFLWKSLAKRRRIAADYRQKSSVANEAKTQHIMDVNPDEVARRMQRAGVRRLVHGHTHRAADHDLRLGDQSATRHVLAEWHQDRGEVLVHDDDGWHRERIE